MAPTKRERPEVEAPAADEELFPRGRSSVLTPLEERKLKLKAKADFEKEASLSTRPAKRNKRSAQKGASAGGTKGDDEGSLFKMESAGNLPKFVDILKFSNLSKGGKVWGAILEVSDKRLTVSLPHGLRGVVAADHASDVIAALTTQEPSRSDRELRAALLGPPPRLSELFYPGQFVQCAVRELQDNKGADDEKEKETSRASKRKVHLSLLLKDICKGMEKTAAFIGAALPACIRTVEDHGCICDLGVSGMTAFLPLKDYHATFGAHVRAVPGQLIQVVVKKAVGGEGGKQVVVGCEAGDIAGSMLRAEHGVSHGNLLPGHLVTVTVRAAGNDGLFVTFLKFFQGVIDRYHFPHAHLGSWRSHFQPGMRLKARILHISTSTKTVRLTLLQNLLDYHLPQNLPTLGAVYEDVSVFRPDNNLGVLVKVPTEPIASLGFIHISNLEPKQGAKTVSAQVGKEFPAGSVVRAKVVGYRLMDALMTLTARAEAVEAAEVTWATLQAGMQLWGRVHTVKENGITVQVTPAIRGLVPLKHATDTGNIANLPKRFAPGKMVKFRVLEADEKKKRAILTLRKAILGAKNPPIHPKGSGTRLGVDLDGNNLEPKTKKSKSAGDDDDESGGGEGAKKGLEKLTVGEVVDGEVKGCEAYGLFVGISGTALSGLVHLSHLPDKKKATKLEEHYPKGTKLRVAVAAVDLENGRLSLSMKSKCFSGEERSKDSEVAKVSKVKAAGEENGEDIIPGFGPPVSVEKGDRVHGYVRRVNPAKTNGPGVYVTLSDTQVGRIQLRYLSDDYIKDPVKEFPDGKRIMARVLSCEHGRVELTRKTQQGPIESTKQNLDDFELGQELTGEVKRVEPYGLFVQLTDSTITGLVHISEVSDMRIHKLAEKFPVGKRVRTAVLAVDTDKGRLSLGMKEKYFTQTDTGTQGQQPAGSGDEEMLAADSDEEPSGKAQTAEGGDSQVDIERALLEAYDESDGDNSDSDGDEDGDKIVPVGDNDSDADSDEEGMQLDGDNEVDSYADSDGENGESDVGDALDGDNDESDGDEDDSEGADGDPHGWGKLEETPDDVVDGEERAEAPQKSRRQRKREREEAEAEVRKAEKAKLKDAKPASTDDHERLVLENPNSSWFWIQYMAFLLGMAEVAKAREVAERALRKIDYRQGSEKFNIWVALLNLENSFSEDPETDAAALLQRALQQNDAKKMYLAAIDIFERSKRSSLLQTCAKGLRRKFRDSCKVWLRLTQLQLSEGKPSGKILEDATKVLPKRKHVKYLSKVALMEYKQGTADRGRGIFENVLLTYPKRTDIWGVYIDQEIKTGKPETVRNLFERTIHLNLKPKKMRYFFKRYVAFESEHGTEQQVEYVKQRALEFIESHGNVGGREE